MSYNGCMSYNGYPNIVNVTHEKFKDSNSNGFNIICSDSGNETDGKDVKQTDVLDGVSVLEPVGTLSRNDRNYGNEVNVKKEVYVKNVKLIENYKMDINSRNCDNCGGHVIDDTKNSTCSKANLNNRANLYSVNLDKKSVFLVKNEVGSDIDIDTDGNGDDEPFNDIISGKCVNYGGRVTDDTRSNVCSKTNLNNSANLDQNQYFDKYENK